MKHDEYYGWKNKTVAEMRSTLNNLPAYYMCFRDPGKGFGVRKAKDDDVIKEPVTHILQYGPSPWRNDPDPDIRHGFPKMWTNRIVMFMPWGSF